MQVSWNFLFFGHFSHKSFDELIQLGQDLNSMGEAIVRVEWSKWLDSFWICQILAQIWLLGVPWRSVVKTSSRSVGPSSESGAVTPSARLPRTPPCWALLKFLKPKFLQNQPKPENRSKLENSPHVNSSTALWSVAKNHSHFTLWKFGKNLKVVNLIPSPLAIWIKYNYSYI